MKRRDFAFLIVLILLPWIAEAAVADRVVGRILINVEDYGAAWYVNPIDARRYALGRPEDALEVMRSLGLGISNADFDTLTGSRAMRRRLAGRILLKVESRGEAYYVSTTDYELHSLGRPTDALAVMRALGLGITRNDLNAIPLGGSDFAGIDLGVPFTPQAPFGEWSDARQQEGCEESSVLMAMKWVRGESLTRQEAKDVILAMSEWQRQEFGYFEDTSAHDTATRLFNRWFNYAKVDVQYDISSADILAELENGNVVLPTIDGRKINHNFYVPPGPERHMIVVYGFDRATGEFLTHDPGSSRGAAHRATMAEMDYMLRDYASGRYAPIGEGRTAMIVVRK